MVRHVFVNDSRCGRCLNVGIRGGFDQDTKNTTCLEHTFKLKHEFIEQLNNENTKSLRRMRIFELNHLDWELNIDWDIELKGWIVHLILKSVPQTSKGIWRWGRVGQMGTLDRGEQGHASLTLSCVYLAYREWGTDEGAIRMDKSTYQLPRLGITGQSHCWDWTDWIIVDVVVELL